MTSRHCADFFDANTRHWEDAEILFQEESWANADHLYGFSAECGLKAVIKISGQNNVKKDGSLKNSEYRTHVHELWGSFVSWAGEHKQAAGVHKGAGYLPWMLASKPFKNWSHHDRYAKRCYFNRKNVRLHRMAAENVRRMVWDAIIEGEKP